MYQTGRRRIVFLLSCIAGPSVWNSQSAGQTWVDELPSRIRQSVLWQADHESGDMSDWTLPQFQHAGGGIFNTGDEIPGQEEVFTGASDVVAHSGDWSAKTTITYAVRAENGARAIRLMRWTDRAWDDGGDYYPDSAFYSTWVYFPEVYNPNKYAPWDPGDGGWWNIFQFKGPDENDESQPLWTVDVGHDDANNTMYLYLHSKYNEPASRSQETPLVFPDNQWVHLESFYHSDVDGNGQIKIWQDGRLVFNEENVVTSLGGVSGTDTHAVWGIGNYTDHIDGDPAGVGTASIYFDDSVVSTTRMSLTGDFDRNGKFECSDVDALVQAIALTTADDAQIIDAYDLTADGTVDVSDLTVWLANAGDVDLARGKSYTSGDANLDGAVNELDLAIWRENRFSKLPAWCAGDFNGDGVVDGPDFNVWLENSSIDDAAATVPEANSQFWCIACLLAAVRRATKLHRAADRSLACAAG